MKKLIFVIGLILIICLTSSVTEKGAAQAQEVLKRTKISHDGRKIDIIIVPGRPPENFRAPVAQFPEVMGVAAVNTLTYVPAFDWSYGCSATSAAMMAGYYDNSGYFNMYAGPSFFSVMPRNNSFWGVTVWPDFVNGGTMQCTECPLSATHMGFDGRIDRGHVDDYWVGYGDTGDDPYITNSWTEHTHGECTADFMKTNQSASGNSDGSTTFYYWDNGAPFTDADAISEGVADLDGCHGLRLFFESRGYTVVQNYSQYIDTEGLTYGFTFAQYKQEIDAGRPVLIQVDNHTMIGFGYDDAGNTIRLHDTWDFADHSLIWGGGYPYGAIQLQHYGVTVVELAPIIDATPPSIAGTPTDDGLWLTSPDVVFSWTAATDAESDVIDYNLQVGTSPGASDVFNGWIVFDSYVLGVTLLQTVTGSNGQTLYARVRAKNGARLIGDWSGNSDGISLDLTLPEGPDYVLDEGVWENTTSTTFSWPAAIDNESGIVRYYLKVGTTPGGDDVLPETDVGNVLNYTITVVHCQTLYAQVRAENGAGSKGNWSPSSDGISVDLTPPTVPGTPVDAGQWSGTPDVTFSWDAASDDKSGIIDYYLEVGTTPGGNDVFGGWIGNILSYTVTGTHCQTLYARVQAKNGALLVGDWSGNSDGIGIDLTPPTIPGIPTDDGDITYFKMVAFSWDAATDDKTGVVDYQLQVGTTPGGNDVYDSWLGGDMLTANIECAYGTSVYARVRAKNGASLIGDWSNWSDGIYIEYTTLTFGENINDDINNVTYDTYIRTGDIQRHFNFGSEIRIRIGNKKSTQDINRSLIKFKFLNTLKERGVISTINIVSAKLQLCVDYGGGVDQNVVVHRMLKEWREGVHEYDGATPGETCWNWAEHTALDWSSDGASGEGTDYEATAAAMTMVSTVNGMFEWDITNSVRKIFEDNLNCGWLLKTEAETNNGHYILLRSKENKSETQRPRLIIKFGPETLASDYNEVDICFGESGMCDYSGITFDSYMDKIKPDYNMGASVLMRIGNDGMANFRPNRSLIKFDFMPGLINENISSTNEIISAKLDLYICSSEGLDADGFFVDVIKLKREWNEGASNYAPANYEEVTWNYARNGSVYWTDPGAASMVDDRVIIPDNSIYVDKPGWFSWDVTESLLSMIESNQNYGWLVQAQNEAKDKYYRVCSSENSSLELRPMLTIVVKKSVPALARQFAQPAAAHKQFQIQNMPTSYKLNQNYPNPFNSETVIQYELPEISHVSLIIYNIQGEKVKTLIDARQNQGYYTAHWNGVDNKGTLLSTGIYIYQLRTNNFEETRKMLYVR